MSITVTIHSKPYVAHYMCNRYGSPVVLPRKTKIKKTFLSCIGKQFEPAREKYLKALPAKFEVKLSKHDLSTHGHSVSEQHAFFINGVFEEKIKNEMFFEVNVKHYVQGKKLHHAIREWQEENGFTEEIFSHDAIRRAYYDMRNAAFSAKNKNSQNTHKFKS